jgi:hypothetical protein
VSTDAPEAEGSALPEPAVRNPVRTNISFTRSRLSFSDLIGFAISESSLLIFSPNDDIANFEDVSFDRIDSVHLKHVASR